MAITIAGTRFDYVDYDERGDTLFLSVEAPNNGLPEDGYETPEGHLVVFDERGALVSIEFLSPRRLLERDRELRLTLPEHVAVAHVGDLAQLWPSAAA